MHFDDAIEPPEGVSVHACEGGGYELRIVGADANALIWRLHDVVGMIQDGRFEAYLERTDRRDAHTSP